MKVRTEITSLFFLKRRTLKILCFLSVQKRKISENSNYFINIYPNIKSNELKFGTHISINKLHICTKFQLSS